MRAGLSTIQQTLTPEAAGVLNLSIAEAARRNHGQTTPLHVAATLLAAPSGFLRQACIKSHPNSSHPLQCRALELCFSVALERLPTAQTSSSPAALEPPISNALMAALKRAQAHQRRGCPEQQQQPLLAVKVELEQLIISILDDPSVSRVMREASFSSPAVKATIEQTLNSNPAAAGPNPAAVTLGFRPSLSPAPRNIYLNPRLQQSATATATATASVAGAHSTQQRAEEVKKIVEILSRPRKKNPVLVGESEPEAVVRELMNRIEDSESNLKNVKVISLEKEFGSDKATMLSRVTDLDNLVESMIGTSGLILDFGDLKWLVEQPAGSVPPQQVVTEEARAAVAEVGKLLWRFGDGSSNPNQRLWLIGTATCETYLRCQVYHPTMETDWDLQAVPIAARSPMFPRLGTTGILNNSAESMSHLRNLAPTASSPMRRLSENPNPSSLCPVCKQSYEQELAKLVASESEKPSTPLPAWLQNAKVHPVEEEQLQKKDLQKKWNETCRRAHPQFHRPILGAERMINPTPFSMTGLCSPGPKPNLLLRPGLEPKSFNLKSPLLQKGTLQLKPSPVLAQPTSPPASPVRTELALGREPEKPVNEGVRDFLSCIPSDKMFAKADTDSFKKLLKGLTDAAWWQKDAASAVASIVSRSKPESRSDRWILFGGPDRVGKKKMVHALSDYVCGSPPIVISFGPVRANDQRVRGKTPVDRIAEGVRRDPFSVIMLEDVDEADMLVRGSIRKAMERGRISDSHGREINLGSVTFILAANWSPDHIKATPKESSFDEEKLANSLRAGWQLRFSISEKTTKRRANWLQGGSLAVKPRTDLGLLGFDLNETVDDQNDGSRNSSDLTTEHELDLENKVSSNSAVYRELLCKANDSVIFKPLDFESMQEEIAGSISKKFIAFVGDHRVSIDVDDEALERILGGVWLSGIGLEEWIDRTMGPSFDRLRTRLISNPSTDHDGSVLVRLECGGYSDTRAHVEWLPGRVEVAVDGL